MKNYYTTKDTAIYDGCRVNLLILRPTSPKAAADTPIVLWIHGGGYATGMPEMAYFTRAIDLVKYHGAVVVSPDYRLSYKAPYPAALLDCYAALKYVKDNAARLGASRDRIMVGGESAGGGLTAALCMAARDMGEINIAFQMPLYPMLSDIDTPSSKDNHALPWNTFFNHAAWKMYLKDSAPTPYAAPARQTDYTNLPPCYTFVGRGEPFYCETVAYVNRLKKAGVKAEIDVYPPAMHAFDMLAPHLPVSKKAKLRFNDAFAFAARNYTAKQKADE